MFSFCGTPRNEPMPLNCYLNQSDHPSSSSVQKAPPSFPIKDFSDTANYNLNDRLKFENCQLRSTVDHIYSNRVYNHQIATYSKILAFKMKKIQLKQTNSPLASSTVSPTASQCFRPFSSGVATPQNKSAKKHKHQTIVLMSPACASKIEQNSRVARKTYGQIHMEKKQYREES